MELLQRFDPVTAAVALLATAALVVVLLVLVPSNRLGQDRRYYGVEDQATLLSRVTNATTSAIDTVVRRRVDTGKIANALDRAGIRMALPDLVLVVGAVALAAIALGSVLANLVVGLLLGAFACVASWLFVSVKAGRRQSAFAEQLDDLLQLMASSLRAGHSLLQSLDSVSHELEEPASSEVARIVNQVRVGRDLGAAMDETAERMDSDDFRWIAQAVAIHRTVGGNLAEVLDTVSETIRERNQIRRQVKALSAEGKLSAYILLALPIGVACFLGVTNPAYMSRLFDNMLGLAMVVVGVFMLAVGALWMRKMVTIKF